MTPTIVCSTVQPDYKASQITAIFVFSLLDEAAFGSDILSILQQKFSLHTNCSKMTIF
jgi:hypothetical protein